MALSDVWKQYTDRFIQNIGVVRAKLASTILGLQVCFKPCHDTSSSQSSQILKSVILQEIQQHASYNAFRTSSAQILQAKAKGSPLETLPAEIQLMILRSLTKVEDLRNLSLSSSILNQNRLQHKNAVLSSVLWNEMGTSIFDEAYWVLRASQCGFDTSNHPVKINQFLTEWTDSAPDSLVPSAVPAKAVINMSAFHRRITALVHDFCLHAFSAPPLAVSKVCQYGPTSSEALRICRAFYRFELYCNLYRPPPSPADPTASPSKFLPLVREQSYQLFVQWSAWENEEIACVRDYLVARLANAFSNIENAASASPLELHIFKPWEQVPQDLPKNHIAFCSVLAPSCLDENAPAGVNLLPTGPNTQPLTEMLLSRGLDFLSRFLTADSPNLQYQMFQSVLQDLFFCDTERDFISDALRERPHDTWEDNETVEPFCHSDPQVFKGDDGAAGPNFAWTWANGNTFQPFYAQSYAAYLRRLGYVMWDKERLSKIFLFQKSPRQPPEFFDSAPDKNTMVKEHQTKCSRLCPSSLHESDEKQIQPGMGAKSDAEIDSTKVSEMVDAVDDPASDRLIPESNSPFTIGQTTALLHEDTAPPSQVLPAHFLFYSGADDELPDILATSIELRDNETMYPTSHCHALAETISRPQTPISELPTDIVSHLPNRSSGSSASSTSSNTSKNSENSATSSRSSSPSPMRPTQRISTDSEDSGIEQGASDNEDTSAYDAAVSELNATTAEAAYIAEAEYIAEKSTLRKMARPISPRARMLKLHQVTAPKDDNFTSNSEIEASATILCKTPGAAAVPVHPPPPPASECSTTSDDSINFITSPPSSTKSQKRTPSHPNVTKDVDGPLPYLYKEDLEAPNAAAEQPASPNDTDQLRENIYMKDPSEVAAWIERSTSRRSSSSESGKTSMASTSTTKQQRKKANRKARQRTLELATKMEQEILAERMRVEEAKKEHQKMKKERKKLEKEMCGGKGKAKAKSKTAPPTKKTMKERKTGYVIG